MRSGGLALVLAATLSACATTNSNPYPYFERLAIEASTPPVVEDANAVASTGDMMAVGAAAGASGALVTGLLVSLACGPLFAVCFAGTGVAAVGGATVGAAMGGSTALTAEDAERVTRHIEYLQDAHNLSEDLAEAVSAQLPAERLSAPDTADARLALSVQGLRVAPGFDDTVSTQVAVNAHLEWDLDRETPQETSRSFVCLTEPSPLEDWLAITNKAAERGLSRCVENLASQISTALQAPSDDAETNPEPSVGFGNYDPAAGEW